MSIEHVSEPLLSARAAQVDRAGVSRLTSGWIVSQTFAALLRSFFDEAGSPKMFTVDAKRSTQDDPFDRMLAAQLTNELAPYGLSVATSSTLASPDVVVFDPVALRNDLRTQGRPIGSAVGIEVKSLLWLSTEGPPPRASGIDFSSTPPAPMTRVQVSSLAVSIPSMLLFATHRPISSGGSVRSKNPVASSELSSMMLIPGGLLNEDQSVYDAAVGVRNKEVGLGSYADGFDRRRPMFVFPNPLTVPYLVASPSMVVPASWIPDVVSPVQPGSLSRTRSDGSLARFACFQPFGDEPVNLLDPFPKSSHSTQTQRRTMFTFEVGQDPLPL